MATKEEKELQGNVTAIMDVLVMTIMESMKPKSRLLLRMYILDAAVKASRNEELDVDVRNGLHKAFMTISESLSGREKEIGNTVS